jgi:4-hydroxy-tetrahydrodipicolinate reductase
MPVKPARAPRLVIYGIGQFGQYIARFAHQKNWPIVAAYNRAGPKVGQDIGRLARLGRDIGVLVQDCDNVNYQDLDADIGVVTVGNHLAGNLPAYRRLLGAGLNVICHGAESYYPYGCDPEVAAEIDTLAKKNEVTFLGSGIWDMSRIWAGILIAGPCTELHAMNHSSITDCERVGKVQMMFTGVGLTVADFKTKLRAENAVVTTYKTITEHVLTALGYSVSENQVRVEPVVFDAPIFCQLLEREIPAGDCVGTRIIVETETREGVTGNARIELRLFKEGEVEHMLWSVDGKPASRIRIERDDSAHATAACLFNRIPDVIAAPPGIVLVSELKPMKHTALVL